MDLMNFGWLLWGVDDHEDLMSFVWILWGIDDYDTVILRSPQVQSVLEFYWYVKNLKLSLFTSWTYCEMC